MLGAISGNLQAVFADFCGRPQPLSVSRKPVHCVRQSPFHNLELQEENKETNKTEKKQTFGLASTSHKSCHKSYLVPFKRPKSQSINIWLFFFFLLSFFLFHCHQSWGLAKKVRTKKVPISLFRPSLATIQHTGFWATAPDSSNSPTISSL